MAVKRQIGLRDFHVAPLTSDTTSGTEYGDIVKIPGIISANISIERGTETYSSDDTTEEIISSLSSITVEVEVSNLSASERKLLLGQKVNKGVIAANVDDNAGEVAIMFRSQKTNGHYRYICLPKGKFSEPAESYATKTDSTTAQTLTMTFTGMHLVSNGNYKISVDSDESGVDSSFISSFFTEVKTDVPSESLLALEAKTQK